MADGLSAVALIAHHYPSLSDSHKRLADFVMSSPHEAALMTQEAISEAVGVSKATANRLGKKLGLSGYPELQQQLRSELKNALQPLEDLRDTIGAAKLARGTPWAQSIEEDLERIRTLEPVGGEGAFGRASTWIAEARKVLFAGFGSSAFIAQYGAFCLGTLRDSAVAAVHSSGEEGTSREILDAGPNDIAVIIAFARYSRAIARVTQQLHAQGVRLVCITDSAASPVLPFASAAFIVERKSGFVLTGSGAGAVSVVEALLRGAAAVLGDDAVSRRTARLTSTLGSAVMDAGEPLEPAKSPRTPPSS